MNGDVRNVDQNKSFSGLGNQQRMRNPLTRGEVEEE